MMMMKMTMTMTSTTTTTTKKKNNNNSKILWHPTALPNLLSEGLKINENSSHNDDAPVLYEQVA